MYDRILVALDGTERAERVLPHAIQIARAFGGKLVLLQVLTGRADVLQQALDADTVGGPTAVESGDAIGNAEADAAAAYFARVQANLTDSGVAHEVLVLEGEATELLATAVRDQHIDLVAMITPGRSALGRLIRGSTPEKLLQEIDVPVLLLRVDK